MVSNMKYDCGFSKENKWFRYRTGGIIVNNGKMLFVKCGFADYYYMIGGGVQMGETSEKCIEREIFEETGLTARVDHLAVVSENFFKGFGGVIDGFDCQTLEFYYYMNVETEDLVNCKTETDAGEKLVWIPIEDIKTSQIKPDFIKERISGILNSSNIIHIIDERDR